MASVGEISMRGGRQWRQPDSAQIAESAKLSCLNSPLVAPAVHQSWRVTSPIAGIGAAGE